MSPLWNSFRNRRDSADEGFTLIEVLVALVLFALFSTAALPLVITGLRTGTVSKLDTGAKNLTQERFEKMRNLPFHTPQSSNAGPDLLDRYFPNLVAAANADAPGFVTATGARRPGEPAGAFYRVLVPAAEISPDAATASTFDRYTQRVATQFLNSAGQVLTPTAWDSLSSPADEALPSLIVRVTATTTWQAGSLSKSYTVSTEITEGRAAPPIARAELRATAVRLSSVHKDAFGTVSDLLLEAGAITADGQVARGAKAAAAGRGVFASLVPGTRVDGAGAGGAAPTDKTTGLASIGTKNFVDAGAFSLAGFGESTVEPFFLGAASGQFQVGSATAPVRSAVKTAGELRFTNKPNLADADLMLAPDLPVVRALGSGSETTVSTGYMFSTGGASTNAVRASASMVTQTFGVLPTSYANDGLIQVQLVSSTVTCTAGSGASAPDVDYVGRFRYWKYDPALAAGGAYTEFQALGDAATVDELAALLSSDVVTHRTAADIGKTYADYFSSLSSATSTSLANQRLVEPPRYEANHPSLIQLTTISLRSDVESSVNIALGAASCRAEDRR